MELYKKLLLIATAIIVTSATPQTEKPKSTVTRTELRVSKSLNPEDTQTLNVMTRDGSVAQLIVKKRDPKFQSTGQTIKSADSSKLPSGHYSKSFYTNWIPVSSVYIQPNLIRLDTIALVRNNTEDSPKKAVYANLGNVIDSDRIPNVPKPITIRSEEVFVKQATDKKRGRSVVTMDSDGIPLVEGVRVPDDESDKRQTWRNARVINGELVPYEDGYKPPAAVPVGKLVYASQIKKEKEDAKSIGPFSKEDNFKSQKETTSWGPFTVRDNIENGNQIFQNAHQNIFQNYPSSFQNNYQNKNTQNGNTITQNPNSNNQNPNTYIQNPNTQNTNNQNPNTQNPNTQNPNTQNSNTHNPNTQYSNTYIQNPNTNTQMPNTNIQNPNQLQQTQNSQHQHNQNGRGSYVRFSGDGIGPFTRADNTQIPNSKLIDYIKGINDEESKRDYFSNRKYRSYEVDNGAQMQRRMLQNPGYPSYPNSALYSPPSAKLSPVTFNEGVRTPVLQYAHPELGVQPARASSEDEEKRMDYFSNKNDYNPYNDDLDGGRQNQFYDNNLNNLDYYRKDVMNYPYNTYYIKPKQAQPFWMKITESIKDNVQSGFQRMQQLTRPVFEPLVEATHKISHNLGFSPAPSKGFQDKVGFLAPALGTSAILPALGLVAGGAALGLGAAAVGRFLHPGDMRALAGVPYPNDILLIMEDPNVAGTTQDNRPRRYRRSLESDNDILMQELAMSVERDSGFQQVGSPQQVSGLQHLSSPHLWTDTPCAKRLFCEVMQRQPEDEVNFMEKKMDTLLSRVHPQVARSVSNHLQEVMESVKSRDCSKFICTRRLSPPVA